MNFSFLFSVLIFSMPIVFSLVCLGYSFYFLKTARRLEDTPTSKIRSAAQGYVELNGHSKSISIDPVHAPLSQEACAWYRYRIEELTRTYVEGRTQMHWSLVEQKVSTKPFLLSDNTGECIILPQGAQVIPTGKQSWRGHSRKGSPPPKSFWLWLLYSCWGRYRYTEERVELDKPLFTSGRFYTFRKNDPLTKKYPMLHDYLEHHGATNVHLLSQEDLDKNKSFIISSISQEKLIRGLKFRAFSFFVAFVGFAGVSTRFSFPAILDAFKVLNSLPGIR